ncbi:capping complex subunit for YIEGIA [Dethiobacter alkaliphilus]|uniref:Uncharacterized protein n=1 Tax=Dethiobacter alkaliphilus AHT 1 TaxID=555088 RepID=C0GI43_DETAL|nr:hypothetical protein [Dethiobacter alkaliphilus]EEG77117.1 conserved hypothetical protein [Dethiobacter alkaliphilus AHT 1]MCW3491504.1 hypothetical protein [Dethiobacter alkaliphilus]
MDVAIKKLILAAVTTHDKQVSGVPTFYADNEEERARMSTILSRVLEAVAHDMGNGVYIIVKH